jgi:hypothetical protein
MIVSRLLSLSPPPKKHKKGAPQHFFLTYHTMDIENTYDSLFVNISIFNDLPYDIKKHISRFYITSTASIIRECYNTHTLTNHRYCDICDSVHKYYHCEIHNCYHSLPDTWDYYFDDCTPHYYFYPIKLGKDLELNIGGQNLKKNEDRQIQI